MESNNLKQVESEDNVTVHLGGGGGTNNGGAESMASGDESGEESGEQVDEDECERRRADCLTDMRELEFLFVKLKDALIQEKQMLIDHKLREIEDETAEEFTQPLFKMKQNMEIKIRLATLLRDYRLKNVEHLYEYEEMCAKQSLVNDKTALFDRHVVKLESEIREYEEKKRQLTLDYNLYQLMQNNKNQVNLDEEQNKTEEMSNDLLVNPSSTSIEASSENTNQLRKSKRNSKKTILAGNGKSNIPIGDRMMEIIRPHHQYFRQSDRNPSYIVYSLHDYDILEDWSIINMHNSLKNQLNHQNP